MSRMTAHRTALAATLVTPFLLPLWAAGPAQAHGAPTDPVSRVYACSPDGGSAGTSACRAAIAANGAPFTLWDNLRVADVNGRDRQTIPDGKLCSGNLPAYKGLDLTRADWPSTRLKPGATMTMKYASTIPHTGTFKLYLTKPGYDPGKPLTWSEIPDQPFAAVTDPALTNGAYRITAKLPADRTGHHVLYTIWQNTSTSDTYYSCSDVVFPAAKSGGTGTKATASTGGSGQSTKKPASKSPTATPRPAQASPTPTTADSPAASTPDSTPLASTPTADSSPSAPMLAGGAAAVLVLTGGVALALRLRRR
jgi:predicted carbohydrate-binding protein with CBM5 and CBM33 domain